MRNTRNDRRRGSTNERGFVLIVVLIMIALSALLGISAVRATSVSETYSNNVRTQNLAATRAQSILRYCEDIVRDYEVNAGETYPALVSKIQLAEIDDENDSNAIWKNARSWSSDSTVAIEVNNIAVDGKNQGGGKCVIQKMKDGSYLVTSRALSNPGATAAESAAASDIWYQSVLRSEASKLNAAGGLT